MFATLSSFLIVLLNPLKQIEKAKDARKVHDLAQIRTALDTYYNDKNCYPASLNSLNSEGALYLKEVPKDPDTKNLYPYQHEGNCSQWNVLFAKLSSPSSLGSQFACPLENLSTCVPQGYEQSKYICVVSGQPNCSFIAQNQLPLGSAPLAPTPFPVFVPTPTPTPIPPQPKIFISYYDATNKAVKFTKSVNGGSSWNINTIDSCTAGNGGGVGQYIAMDAIGVNTLVMSYFEDGCITGGAPRFARSDDGGANWNKSDVQITGQRGGWNTSISAADANNIFISYRQRLNGEMIVVVLHTTNGIFQQGLAPDNRLVDGPNAGIWGTSEEIDYMAYNMIENGHIDLKFAKFGSAGSIVEAPVPPESATGYYPSMRTLDANRIFIAYGTSVHGVKLAKSTDGGLSWSKFAIDSQSGASVLGQKSLFLLDANTIFVSYGISSTLKFAKSNDGGSSWTTSSVDTQFGGSDAVISASDANKIFIAYYDSVNKDLRLAKSTNGGSTWTTSTIDSTGDVGSFPSIVVISPPPTPTPAPPAPPTPTSIVSTPTPTLGPTPTLTPIPPTPTPVPCLQANKNFACTGANPLRCNSVAPGTGTFCSRDCNEVCQ